jgi:dCTP deaminase
MVLTDREIQAAIQHRHILIDPAPSELAYSSTSLDLTLSKALSAWRSKPVAGVEPYVVSPATDGYSYTSFRREYSESNEIGPDGYIVEPNAFVLGWTEETIELPVESRIAARVEGKSSLARLGIGIHVTAPTVHAGFHGPIQLEICNHGPLRVKLLPGMRICQLIFEQTLGTPEKGYAGQFSGQTSA